MLQLAQPLTQGIAQLRAGQATYQPSCQLLALICRHLGCFSLISISNIGDDPVWQFEFNLWLVLHQRLSQVTRLGFQEALHHRRLRLEQEALLFVLAAQVAAGCFP